MIRDTPTTGVDADRKLRAEALIASHRAMLDLACETAKGSLLEPRIRFQAERLRQRCDQHEGWLARPHSDPGHTLGMLGENGFAPAVRDVLRQAQFAGRKAA